MRSITESACGTRHGARLSAIGLTGLLVTIGSLMGGSASSASNLRAPLATGFRGASLARGDVVGGLHHITRIGSTVDPLNGDLNPYGLAIAPATSGLLTAGDLVVCNFNDSVNIQGLGTSIVALHPQPGSTPIHVLADPTLTGCNAVALGPDDGIWAAALDANDNPIVSPSGQLISSLNTVGWAGPWGQIFSPIPSHHGVAAFYESNSNDGSIVRINVTKTGKYTFEKIASGFLVNHGVPGTILAPAGLTIDAQRDVLYIVDGASNRVIAFSKPGDIPRGGIIRTPTGFTGPDAGAARVVFTGQPLNAPISAALLFNGDLAVGNTANNHLIEIDPRSGKAVGDVNLDKGPAGALFGIVASGTSMATTQIYFNDDNENDVKVLAR